MSIYLDNAATSFPKPESVYKKVMDVMMNCGASASRGSYNKAVEASRYLYNTRKLLGELFGVKDISRISFTKNATEGINIALKGILKKGDHVVITSLEHNAVYRTLNRLKELGIIEYDIVQADVFGNIDVEDFKDKIKENTKLFVCNHASNLIGTITPIREIGLIARSNGILMMTDCSQTAGVVDINVERDNIDILCFTGHKALFGPQGTGGVYLGMSIDVLPLLEGGTGGDSNLLLNPSEYPDRLEAGTQNVPGIAGLGEGIKFIKEITTDSILFHERKLLKKLYNKLSSVKDIEIHGSEDINNRLGIFTFNLGNISSEVVGHKLDKYFNIMVRTGLHCTPLAHSTVGTINKGSVRVSTSYFNTIEDIEKFADAICKIERGEV